MARILLLALAAAALCGGVARADAPEPTRTLDLEKFMGRWYEIMRTPNITQRNCFAAYQMWEPTQPGRFLIKQYCHRGSPDGPEHQVDTQARVLNPPDNTKFEATFFAGLIKQRYWVIDHDADYRWMIASTADGRYPALLARTPSLSATEQARLKARMSELGFQTDRLQMVGQ